MKYQANRGGHAPGHLREAFCDLVDFERTLKLDDFLPKEIQEIFYDEKKKTVKWLLGQLWNCTDVMPHLLCSDLDLQCGSYACGVRKFKEMIS